MPPDGFERFSIQIPPKWIDELKAMRDEAVLLGRAEEFLKNLKELKYRLSVEPDEWGESREYLPVLQLEMRFGVVGSITVWYGVDVVRQTVIVKSFGLRGSP